MEEDGGLFNIEISSSGESTTTEKLSRDFQSEEDFQAVKREWNPKIEGGEIWKNLQLPRNRVPSKADSQMILHAVEELYFFKRYEEADRITREALKGEMPYDLRKTLQDYQKTCKAKLDATESRAARDYGECQAQGTLGGPQ